MTRALAGPLLAAALAVLGGRAADAAPERSDHAGLPSTAVAGALELLDRDAAVWLRIDADALAALTTELEARLGIFARSARDTRDSVRGWLGGDPLTPEGWRQLGLDPTRPVLIAAGAMDDDAVLAGLGLSGTLLRPQAAARADATAAPLWRSRLMLPVGDPARLGIAIDRAAGAWPEIVVLGSQSSHADRAAVAERLARAVGVAPADAADARDTLDRAGVLALSTGPGGGLVVAHRRGSWLVIDVLAPLVRTGAGMHLDRGIDPMGDSAPRPTRNAGKAPTLRALGGASIVAALVRRTPRTRAAQLVANAAGRHLLEPGISAVVDPARLAEALLWDDLVRSAPQVDRTLIGLLRTRCERSAEILTGGPLGPVGLTVHAAPRRLALAVSWQVDTRLALDDILSSTADHPLPRPDDLPAADLVARTYVSSWEPLVVLPHQGLRPDLPPVLSSCAPRLVALVAALGWPQQIAALIDNLRRAEPAAAAIVPGLGEALLAVHRLGTGRDDTVAALEIVTSPAAHRRLAELADIVWGPSTMGRWGHGPVRAFAYTRGAALTAGLAIRDSTEVHVATERRAPPPPPGTVAEVRASTRALAALHPLAALLGQVTASVRFDGGVLRGDLAATR